MVAEDEVSVAGGMSSASVIGPFCSKLGVALDAAVGSGAVESADGSGPALQAETTMDSAAMTRRKRRMVGRILVPQI